MGTATIEQGASILPAIPDGIDHNQALEVLGLAHLIGIDIDSLDVDSAAEVAFNAAEKMAEAVKLFQAVCAPVNRLITKARQRVRDAIPEGASMLAHPLLDIKLVASPNEWQKDVPTLLKLRDLLKPDEFREALMFKGVDLKDKPLAIEAAIKAGGKPIYEAHAGVLNRLRDAKHYGADSAVGKIIDEGLKSVPKGSPTLQIALNASAVKAVTP
jgi:hypothetical protein